MCTGKTDIPGWKIQKTYLSTWGWGKKVANCSVAAQNTKAESNFAEIAIKKWRWKEYSIFILYLFFTKIMGFIKPHCIQANSHFYQASCLNKKEQSCASEIPICLLCSMWFCSMANLYLVNVFFWIGNLEKL